MIRIPQSVFEALIRHAQREDPRECCGVLIGRCIGDDAWVEGTVDARNIAENDRRRNYQIDWHTLLTTARSVRHEPEQIVGFYHSHPDGSIRPSERDRREAWLDHSYVILSMGEGRCLTITSWRVRHQSGAFEPEPLVVEPDGDQPCRPSVGDAEQAPSSRSRYGSTMGSLRAF